jgi:hypothetical protein
MATLRHSQRTVAALNVAWVRNAAHVKFEEHCLVTQVVGKEAS